MKFVASTLGSTGLIPIVAVSGLALLAGFGLGRLSAPSVPQEPKPFPATKTMPGKSVSPEAVWQEVEAASEAPSPNDVAEAASISSPRLRERALEEVLSRASLTELRQALDWANSLPDGPMKKAALEKILRRWGELDGAGATAYAVQMYNETGNANLLREALAGWAVKDPESAIRQLSGLGLGEGLSADIRRDLMGQWADLNPTGAAAYAMANRETDNWRGLVGTVADEWSKRDPKAAADWASSLQTGRDKRGAIYLAIANWADADPKGVANYVSSQASGENKDMMAGSLARHVGQDDPASGLKWAALVSDPAAQERAVAGALADLYRRDTNQALSLLQSSAISAQVRQAALNRMTNRGGWWR